MLLMTHLMDCQTVLKAGRQYITTYIIYQYCISHINIHVNRNYMTVNGKLPLYIRFSKSEHPHYKKHYVLKTEVQNYVQDIIILLPCVYFNMSSPLVFAIPVLGTE